MATLFERLLSLGGGLTRRVRTEAMEATGVSPPMAQVIDRMRTGDIPNTTGSLDEQEMATVLRANPELLVQGRADNAERRTGRREERRARTRRIVGAVATVVTTAVAIARRASTTGIQAEEREGAGEPVEDVEAEAKRENGIGLPPMLLLGAGVVSLLIVGVIYAVSR